MKKLFSPIALAFSLVLPACVVPPPQTLSDAPLQRMAAIGPEGLFAAESGGRRVALAEGSLRLLDLDAGTSRVVDPGDPVALAWNPVGGSLAAAFAVGVYETRLVQYSALGEMLHEARLPMALSLLTWSLRGDLLATGVTLQSYSFGANLRQRLYRVDGATLTELDLSDTTLKPATARHVAPLLVKLQPVAFSPEGDELVYVSLHDPPEFPPYLELRYRNWSSEKARSLLKLPLQELQLEWDASGQGLSLRTAAGVQRVELWPTDGMAPSASSGYRLIDGRFFEGAELLADWGRGARMQPLPDGRFLLAVDGFLYLGKGLHASTATTVRESVWTLRRWRFEELISPTEYRRLLEKGAQP